MKALLSKQVGGPETLVLEDVPSPKARPGGAVISVKAAGVIAAASSQQKVDLAISRGAESGVVYPTGPFDRDGQKELANLFKEAVGPNGADVCYDGVGGDYAEAAIRCMAWEGRFLVIGF